MVSLHGLEFVLRAQEDGTLAFPWTSGDACLWLWLWSWAVWLNQAPAPHLHFQNCPPVCLFHTLPLQQFPVCKQICLLDGENQVCMHLCQGKEEESQSSWRKAAGVESWSINAFIRQFYSQRNPSSNGRNWRNLTNFSSLIFPSVKRGLCLTL